MGVVTTKDVAWLRAEAGRGSAGRARRWVLIGVAGLVVGLGRGAAAAPIPTCTVTGVRLVGSRVGGAAVDLDLVGGFSGCMGSYAIVGVTPRALSAAPVTLDDYRELAAALRHWTAADGAPAVAGWVRLAPPVAAGMRGAGLRPTRFLQWINEHAAPAWAGAARRPGASLPPVWPPLLPRAFVGGPVAPGARAKAIQARARRWTPPAAVGAVGALRRPSAGQQGGGASRPGSALRQAVPVGLRPPAGRVPVARPATGWPRPPGAPPPGTATVLGRTVPCVVAGPCRRAVLAHDRWVSEPWPIRTLLRLWWWRWWLTAGAALGGVLASAAWTAARRRRNLSWYGDARGPR